MIKQKNDKILLFDTLMLHSLNINWKLNNFKTRIPQTQFKFYTSVTALDQSIKLRLELQ